MVHRQRHALVDHSFRFPERDFSDHMQTFISQMAQCEMVSQTGWPSHTTSTSRALGDTKSSSLIEARLLQLHAPASSQCKSVHVYTIHVLKLMGSHINQQRQKLQNPHNRTAPVPCSFSLSQHPDPSDSRSKDLLFFRSTLTILCTSDSLSIWLPIFSLYSQASLHQCLHTLTDTHTHTMCTLSSPAADTTGVWPPT